MSARDDYPVQAERYGYDQIPADTYDAMCDEIDHLRGDVSVLLSKLAHAANLLRIAAASDVSLWTPEVAR